MSSIDNPRAHFPKPEQAGFGLIPTALALGVIAVITTGAFVAYGNSKVKAQVKREQDNLRHMAAAIDRSYGLLGSFGHVSTARLLNENLVPSRMREGLSLRSDWGSSVAVFPHTVSTAAGTHNAFLVNYPATPAAVCVGLAAAMAKDAHDIEVGGHSVYRNGRLEPGVVAEQCGSHETADMDFIFHSGLVVGQMVAAPPVVLPPPAPTITPPPGSPPIITIPGTPGVDPVAPGTPAVPPAAPVVPPTPPLPPILPPAPPGGAPPPSYPPPPPITTPGAVCNPTPQPLTPDTQTRACPVGQLGSIDEWRTRTQHYTCPEAWAAPVPSHIAYGPWQVSANTCAPAAPACVVPNPATQTQTETRTGNRELTCPAGQTGTIYEARPEQRVGTRTASCPSPTGPVAWTPIAWGSWTGTGPWVETSRTCVATPPPLDGTCSGRRMVVGCATFQQGTNVRLTSVDVGEDSGAGFDLGEYVYCTVGYADAIGADGFPSIEGDAFRYRVSSRGGGCWMGDWDTYYSHGEDCSAYVRVFARNADGTAGAQCFGEAKITFNWQW